MEGDYGFHYITDFQPWKGNIFLVVESISLVAGIIIGLGNLKTVDNLDEICDKKNIQ